MPVQTKLYLGDQPPLNLTLSDEAWVGGTPSESPTAVADFDVAAATVAALKSPEGFPPLSQSVVPGDRVAIALGAGVRSTDEVVRGVVEALEWAGIGRESVTVVAGNRSQAAALRERLEDLTSDGCVVVGHVASDDDALCYLAAVGDEPLLINRQLFEADLVIPVGCGRAETVRDARGPYESIYPRFSDRLTQQRYAKADALDAPTALAARRDETDRAGWLLGAALVVQVIPAHGGRVAHVVAGAPQEVADRVKEVCAAEWNFEMQQPASLVVAALAGGAEEQTWDNVARGLHAAARAADQDQSAVALCTQLDVPPGKALRKLIATGGDLQRAAELQNEQSDDAAAAWEIYKALCRGPVYFMSQIDREEVEDMGMTPIEDAAELTRLAHRSTSCIVLNEVQHAAPHVASDWEQH